MKKLLYRLLAVLCIISLAAACFTGCADKEVPTPSEEQHDTPLPQTDWVDRLSIKTKDPADVALPDYKGGDTLTVGIDGAPVIPDPFYIAENSDTTVSDLVMVRLLETDRSGFVVKNGINGETISYNDTDYTYNGIVSVEIIDNRLEFRLDENIYFSDGVNLTADDVIFTMYVLADPAYDGYSDFASLPIDGIDEYRGNLQQKWKAILGDLFENSETGGYSEKDKELFLGAFEEAGLIFTHEIVQGCVNNFGEDYSDFVLDVSLETLLENEGLQVAFSQYFWDYSKGYGEDGLWYDTDGNSYDLTETFPTVEDYWKLIFGKYGYDIGDEGINYEKIGERDFEEILISVINEKYPELLTATADSDSESAISGIEKTGMYSFSVTLTEMAPEYLEKFCFYIAPLHHYGSREEYKYSENNFGFVKGDLTSVKEKCVNPLGAGAYSFVSASENGDLSLERNTLYYKGCPKIKNLVITADIENADISSRTYIGQESFAENYIETESNTFVIIGMNAEKVSVSGAELSDASVSLRNAFTTVFKAYREIVVNRLENEGVEGINDDTVWASDVDAVTRSARIEAISYLKDAGYKWDSALEKFTEAPVGAHMSYEVKIYKCDVSYTVLCYAKDLFATLGITLEISVQSTRESLENIVYAGEAQMWVMQIDDWTEEDLFDMFHSEGTKNVYSASNDETDKKILQAGSRLRTNAMTEEYNEIINDFIELGVILPLYKYVNAVVYSENILPETITTDMTEYWSWVREVHILEAK